MIFLPSSAEFSACLDKLDSMFLTLIGLSTGLPFLSFQNVILASQSAANVKKDTLTQPALEVQETSSQESSLESETDEEDDYMDIWLWKILRLLSLPFCLSRSRSFLIFLRFLSSVFCLERIKHLHFVSSSWSTFFKQKGLPPPPPRWCPLATHALCSLDFLAFSFFLCDSAKFHSSPKKKKKKRSVTSSL